MQRSSRFSFVLVAVVAALVAFWPGDASAQHRGRSHGHPGGGGRGSVVVVGGGYYGPYYGGYYSPFYYPPFVSPFGWYPYPFGPYPPYGLGMYDNTVSVRVQVTPREAEVYVDGYYAGIVDDFDGTFQRLRLAPGAHDVTLYLAGYRSTTERIYFRPQASYKITHVLEKLAAGEAAEPKPQPTLQSSPMRAGRRGRQPDEPVPGPRAPEPQWPEPQGTNPRAPAAPRAPSRVQSSSFGSLVVRVQPDGAAVVIDEERWQGPEGQDRLVVQLAEGTHHVEIRKDGYTPYTSDVDVRVGETTVLNVSLPPDRR